MVAASRAAAASPTSADLVRFGGGVDALAFGRGLRLDESRRGFFLGLTPCVGAFLGDQVFAPGGQFDLARHFVLGDGPFALDGDGAAFVYGAVRLGLELFPDRRLQGAFDVGLWPDRQDLHPKDLDACGLKPGVRPEGFGKDVAELADSALQGLGERGGGDLVDGVALAQLADDGGHLLLPRRWPCAGRLQAEVEPAGDGHRVDEAVGHVGLDAHVLVVTGDGVEERGQFLIIHRNLAEHGVRWPEPEGLADSLVPDGAFLEVNDVAGGAAQEVADPGVALDAGHGILLNRSMLSKSPHVVVKLTITKQ